MKPKTQLIVVIAGSVLAAAAINHVVTHWPPGAQQAGTGQSFARAEARPGPTVPPVTATTPPPRPRHLQPVYAVPADGTPVPGRQEAIIHEAGVVADWFRRQLGAHPRYSPGDGPVTVTTATLPWTKAELAASEESAERIAPWLHHDGLIAPEAIPVIYLEGSNRPGLCGWTRVEARKLPPVASSVENELIIIPMDSCDIHPERTTVWPQGATYLLAHETTHALGGTPDGSPHADQTAHVTDDPRDVIYQGTAERDWDHLTLDPGHDDYLGHGRSDLFDIATSELLTRP